MRLLLDSFDSVEHAYGHQSQADVEFHGGRLARQAEALGINYFLKGERMLAANPPTNTARGILPGPSVADKDSTMRCQP